MAGNKESNLPQGIKRIIVENIDTGTIIAEITENEIYTEREEYAVRITYDDEGEE